MNVDTKVLAKKIESLRNEMREKCPKLSDEYDFALAIAQSIFEEME